MKRKIKILCIVMIAILLIGISIARTLYNEGMLPVFRADEKIFLEIDELIQTDTGIICVLIPEKIYYRIGEKPQISVLIINRTDVTTHPPLLSTNNLMSYFQSKDLSVSYPKEFS